MERGVVVGGLLISVSVLLAVILNSTASRDPLPIGAGEDEQSSSPAAKTQESSAVDTTESVLDNGALHPGGINPTPSDLGVRETWSQADGPDGRRDGQATDDVEGSDEARTSNPSSQAP